MATFDEQMKQAMALSAAEAKFQQPTANASASSTNQDDAILAQALALSAAEASSNHSARRSPQRIISPAISTALKVGDRVTIKSQRPSNGWGPVESKDIGIITLLLPPTVAVAFGKKTNHLGEHGWTCSISDLQKVTTATSNLPDTTNDLQYALNLQNIETQTQQVRSTASEKYYESKTNHSNTSNHKSLLKQDSTESVALHDRKILDETMAAETLNAIVASCISTGEKFLDTDFPCTFRSLHGEQGERKDGHNGVTGAHAWKRASLCSKTVRGVVGVDRNAPWTVFRSETPAAEDLMQGGLGDCYFISALACIAQRSDLVKNLFVGPSFNELHSKISKHGVYQIRLCKDGYWTVVTIDSMLPIQENGCIAYAKGARLQLWPSLVEKAFAKIHGSYSAIVSGHCDECLSMLTGAPCDKYHLVQSQEESKALYASGEGSICTIEEMWLKLSSCFDNGFLMCASCTVRQGDTEERYKEIGLQCRHAYSILQLKSIQTNANETIHLVELRNPWGRGSWKGDYSVKSNKWTNQLRQEFGYYITEEEQDGGVFWMTLNDWFWHFGTLYVCRQRRNNASSSNGGNEVRAKAPLRNIVIGRPTSRPTLPCFRLEVLDVTDIEMTLHQASARGTLDSIASIGVIVMRECGTQLQGGKSAVSNQLEYVGSSAVQHHTRVRCDVLLQPGLYIIVPIVMNAGGIHASSIATPRRSTLRTSSMVESIVLAVHAPKPVLITELRCWPKSIQQAIVGRVMAVGEPWGNSRDGNVTIYSLTDGGGSYVAVENNSTTSAKITLDLTGSKGLVTSRGSLVTEDMLPAGKKMLINCATSLEAGGWSVSKSIAWQGTHGNTERHEPGVFGEGLHEPF